MTNKIKTISYGERVRFFWILAIISILSLFIYIYAINVTARSAALGQNLERQMTRAGSELDSLEFAYIKLKNNVTLELAYERGFKETKNPLYVSRRPNTSLSINTLNR